MKKSNLRKKKKTFWKKQTFDKLKSNHQLVNDNNFFGWSGCFVGKLHFFEEPHFFNALFAGNVSSTDIQLNKLCTDISLWVMKASEKTALPDTVCNFAFSSMCCIFFGQLLRCAAQTHSTLLCTSTPVWKHQGISLIFSLKIGLVDELRLCFKDDSFFQKNVVLSHNYRETWQ